MDIGNFWPAFLLTLFAGAATSIGSLIALFSKRTNKKMLSVALGFSAGVMIFVSFVELIPAAQNSLSLMYGAKKGYAITILAFFSGIIVAAIIDKLIPSYENPHELHQIEEMDHKSTTQEKSLYRLGILSAVAITIHNFPEGIATFATAFTDVSMGIAIAVAIAIHNIPEGIAVSIPIYHSTGSRYKAFLYSSLSGLAEPLGAVIGFILLRNFFNTGFIAVMLAAVAGIMIYISMDELLPASQKFGEHHLSIYGLIAGMALMAISLFFFM